MADKSLKNMKTILCDRSGGVAHLTLNRPEKLNAINDELREDLEFALRELDQDDDVRVLVIKGAGRAFCSGYDLLGTPGGRSYADATSERPSIAADRDRLRKSIERWMWMWNYRKPIIAQVHGHCIAGGGDLAAMCDLIYCADDAQFGHPAGRAIGIQLTLGLWPLRIGVLKSKELLFTGDLIDGKEAERIGMVNRSMPAEKLGDFFDSLSQRIAMTPADALSIHKHVVNRWSEIMGLRTCVAECAEFDAIFHESPSALEFGRITRERGLKAAFEWRDDPYRQQGQAK